MLQSTQWIYISPHFLIAFMPLGAEMRWVSKFAPKLKGYEVR
ncbi:hypothetical protein THF5H11_50029 [Vibrio jasicida]|jgi:hypothetical protein|uniref:Uncharacterized protein n=1 Tax=Vibrio jasicida TaxID=766224 RepID=A0AAU9QQ04_9VIBR|nr:hypothetical protein THF5H11_50029 [Vibrio jasicida]CAH1594650.1 hypothetical protein THF1C08_350053 [Vibrio jasicida]CAH1596362.1 hypothetical protein THF1A12_30286 [Vibrio jasicida]CAH1606071.1 hypothetical protein THF5G08_200029 [Vibrio jasicida]